MMEEMPKVYQNVQLAYVDADDSASDELIEHFGVENVQTVVVVHPEKTGRDKDLKVGISATDLTELVDAQNKFYI